MFLIVMEVVSLWQGSQRLFAVLGCLEEVLVVVVVGAPAPLHCLVQACLVHGCLPAGPVPLAGVNAEKRKENG